MSSAQINTILPCADVPPRRELALILYEAMTKHPNRFGEPIDSGVKRTARLIKKKKPDPKWCLLLLA